MSDTKAMMPRSTRLYELVSSRTPQVSVAMAAPTMRGRPKSICSAMAAPNISANEVDTDAPMALHSTGRLTHRGRWRVVASLKHCPVTMPKCATLCCNTMSMMVDSVTTHSSA